MMKRCTGVVVVWRIGACGDGRGRKLLSCGEGKGKRI